MLCVGDEEVCLTKGDGARVLLFPLDSRTHPLELTLLADVPRCPRAGVPLLVKSPDTSLDDPEKDAISDRALLARELALLQLLEFPISWYDLSLLSSRDFAELTLERSRVAADTTESRSPSAGIRPSFSSILDSLMLAELLTRLLLLEFLLSSFLMLRELASLETERSVYALDTAEALSPLDDLPPLFCPTLDPLLADDLPLAEAVPS